jgi:hypothetical protein
MSWRAFAFPRRPCAARKRAGKHQTTDVRSGRSVISLEGTPILGDVAFVMRDLSSSGSEDVLLEEVERL